MKKLLILIIIIPFMFSMFNKNATNVTEEMIRIRVLANSNNEHDQNVKNRVSIDLKDKMYLLLKDTIDVDDARNIIKSNLSSIDQLIYNDIKDEAYSYTMNYGYNYFPEKEYDGITYEEGEYESLLVTLGKGEGDNWWCILFPPFCLIEGEESDEEVEYDFFLAELFDSIFH